MALVRMAPPWISPPAARSRPAWTQWGSDNKRNNCYSYRTTRYNIARCATARCGNTRCWCRCIAMRWSAIRCSVITTWPGSSSTVSTISSMILPGILSLKSSAYPDSTSSSTSPSSGHMVAHAVLSSTQQQHTLALQVSRLFQSRCQVADNLIN